MTDHERIDRALVQTALAAVRAQHPAASETALQLAAASRLDAAARALRENVQAGEEHAREVEQAHAARVTATERALEQFVDAALEGR